jgi:hypothetical protein
MVTEIGSKKGYAIEDLQQDLQPEAKKLDSSGDGLIGPADDFARRTDPLSVVGRSLQKAAKDPLDPSAVPRKPATAKKISEAIAGKASVADTRLMALTYDELKGATVNERVQLLRSFLGGSFMFKDDKQQKVLDILMSTPEQLRRPLAAAIDTAGLRVEVFGALFGDELRPAQEFFADYATFTIPTALRKLESVAFGAQQFQTITLNEAADYLAAITRLQMVRAENGEDASNPNSRPEHGVTMSMLSSDNTWLGQSNGMSFILRSFLDAPPPTVYTPGLEASLVRFYRAAVAGLYDASVEAARAASMVEAAQAVERERAAAGDTRPRDQQPERLIIQRVAAAIREGTINADDAAFAHMKTHLAAE